MPSSRVRRVIHARLRAGQALRVKRAEVRAGSADAVRVMSDHERRERAGYWARRSSRRFRNTPTMDTAPVPIASTTTRNSRAAVTVEGPDWSTTRANAIATARMIGTGPASARAEPPPQPLRLRRFETAQTAYASCTRRHTKSAGDSHEKAPTPRHNLDKHSCGPPWPSPKRNPVAVSETEKFDLAWSCIDVVPFQTPLPPPYRVAFAISRQNGPICALGRRCVA